ncbi:MAG: D-glycero-beta-D-manno-heptose 1,7-bisphosphate 7-phosphatase [Burkholderiales bacterium]|jgi:D-glycero-D-manno-heptose 1,7-bisphosphate phosphatase|nr:D-glycero-beta-D-manno-heptose 1,7-bisphosphate 7-phosphatase [Burkholderiales bacterium]
MSAHKLILLDRDGVINEDSDNYIKSVDEWRPIPGSLEAIARLNRAGYRIVVITNQSGIAKGLFDLEALAAMHNKMLRLATEVGGKIDAILFCPHGPEAKCNCRKPKPGMFEQVAMRYDTSLQGVVAVGDSLRDLQAAASQGCKTFLVKTGKGMRTLADKSHELPPGTQTFDDLLAVAKLLVPEDPHRSYRQGE